MKMTKVIIFVYNSKISPLIEFWRIMIFRKTTLTRLEYKKWFLGVIILLYHLYLGRYIIVFAEFFSQLARLTYSIHILYYCVCVRIVSYRFTEVFLLFYFFRYTILHRELFARIYYTMHLHIVKNHMEIDWHDIYNMAFILKGV